LQYTAPLHTLPWDPSIRSTPPVPKGGGSEPLEVGKIQEFKLTHARFRSFTPKGTPPVEGWPVFIYFHGGATRLADKTLRAALTVSS
jgi:acetyl esterase/lipase